MSDNILDDAQQRAERLNADIRAGIRAKSGMLKADVLTAAKEDARLCCVLDKAGEEIIRLIAEVDRVKQRDAKLIEVLRNLLDLAERAEVQFAEEGGSCRTPEQEAADGTLPYEIIDARAAILEWSNSHAT